MLLFTLTIVTCNAQFKVIQGAGLEAGIGKSVTIKAKRPYDQGKAYVYSLAAEYGNFSCIYKLGVELGKFQLISLTTLYMNKGKTFQFNPTQAVFDIGLIFNVTDKIKFKVDHECIHPIVADFDHPVDEIYGGHTARIGIYYNL